MGRWAYLCCFTTYREEPTQVTRCRWCMAPNHFPAGRMGGRSSPRSPGGRESVHAACGALNLKPRPPSQDVVEVAAAALVVRLVRIRHSSRLGAGEKADGREAGSLASVSAMIQCSTATGSSVGARRSTLEPVCRATRRLPCRLRANDLHCALERSRSAPRHVGGTLVSRRRLRLTVC
jgi:hypothetical protein